MYPLATAKVTPRVQVPPVRNHWWSAVSVHSVPITLFLCMFSNLLTLCLGWEAAPSDIFFFLKYHNVGHKGWQYCPTEEPGFQRLYETGHFYDFGLIPFIALYNKFTTELLSTSQSHTLVSVCLAPCFISVDRLHLAHYFKDSIQGVPIQQSKNKLKMEWWV